MVIVQPAYIIPFIIEQPTWGGSYIANFKQIKHQLLNDKRIGQSFELFSGSWLTTASLVPFAYATATDLAHPVFSDPVQEKFSLQEMVDQDPLAVFGQKGIDRGWKSMQVLIKFTQVQNNSYQVHVKPDNEFGKWLPKPESWYFLENGKATLGLSDPRKVDDYKARCIEIDLKAQSLSAQVKAGELAVDVAKMQLKTYIDLDHPRQFVNTVVIEKESVIDLSQGGTHHSWEVDEHLPEGNIVYEVQVDVMDEFCTLRSFDQGNMKSDGSVRPLTIEDYFTALDLDPRVNEPSRYLQNVLSITEGSTTLKTLFTNHYYVTQLLEFSGTYAGAATQTDRSFHHIYALGESVNITIGESTWLVPAGWSFFIPAAVGSYRLDAETNYGKVLITHL